MEETAAIEALSALAQESRLPIFRLLVQEGPEGLSAGAIGQRLGIPPSALSFHLTRLRYAGLITARRNGRQIIYSVDYQATQSFVSFLTESCCRNSPRGCSSDCPEIRSGQAHERPPRQKAGSARRRLLQS